MLGAVVTAYTCPADKSICYSVNSPETHAIFKQLQTQANRFASPAAFTPLAVDGLLGNATAAGVRKAILWAIPRLADGGLKINLITYEPFASSRQLLAPMADAIGTALANAAQVLNLSTVAPTPPSSPASIPTGPFPTAPAYVAPPITAGFWAQRTTAEKAIMGVGAFSLVGTLILLFWPKRRRAA